MKAQQPRKPIAEEFKRDEYLRELDTLHKRINDLILIPALASPEVTKADYVAGDLGTPAAIATALNTVAAALNANTAAVVALLAKLNVS